MSGISRLRAAKKGSTLPIEYPAQRAGRNSAAADCAEPLSVPKKKGAWEVFKKTGVPEGNESPGRGEHLHN